MFSLEQSPTTDIAGHVTLQLAQLEQQLGAATAALDESTAQAGERAAKAAALQQELEALQAQVRTKIYWNWAYRGF